MSDSQWTVFQPVTYQTKFLNQNEINLVIDNLKRSNIQETQIELSFKTQHALKNFNQIYQQQINQEDISYYQDNQTEKQDLKFKKLKDFNSADYEVKLLKFQFNQLLIIFMKIYHSKLKQMEKQYHYKLQSGCKCLKVYYPKGQKLSGFFTNQIFQMKTKLNLYFSNQPNVIEKIKYSAYFNKLIESKSIAAQYRMRADGIELAVFYSNVHRKKQIIDIINKNLFEHTTILSLYDTKFKRQINQNIFKLIASFLGERIRTIERQHQIVIQLNYDKCCILVHDRHECHVDAKDQILEAIGEMIFFKLQGKNMRDLFNKIKKNHKNYPYLRVKYSRRSFYCVFSQTIFHLNKKNLASFTEIFKEYFQNINQQNKLTFFLKNLQYPNFINKISQYIANTNITIENYEMFMEDQKLKWSEIILGVKSLVGIQSVIETRKLFYEIFLKIFLRYDFVTNIVKDMKMSPDSFSNILGLSKPSTILPHDTSHFMSQQQFLNQIQLLSDSKSDSFVETSISQESSGDHDSLKKRGSNQKYKQKKPKHIEIIYPFKQPQVDKDQFMFYELATRQRKLQKALCQKHIDPFAKSKFKIYLLTLKQKVELPNIDDIQKDKIFLSTIIEKYNKISHHFIDLNQYKKIEKQSKGKKFFIFYKVLNQQVYIPSFVLQLLQN